MANFKTVGLGGWGGWPPTQDAWDSRWKRQPVESCKLNKFATYFPCFPSLVFPSFLRRFLPTLLPSFSFASFPPFCISSFLPFYHFLSLFDPVYVFCCAVDIHFLILLYSHPGQSPLDCQLLALHVRTKTACGVPYGTIDGIQMFSWQGIQCF